MTMPHSLTPDWARSKLRPLIEEGVDPEVFEGVLELLAAVAPTQDQDKFKHEAAWAAIDYGYCETEDCRLSSRKHFGIAV